MSKLSELLRAREAPLAIPAIPATQPLRLTDERPAISAIPAIPGTSPAENSNSSKNSRGVLSDLQSESARAGDCPPAQRIIICATCMHYRERPGTSPDGFCRRFDVETWGKVEFRCPGFEPADEAVRAREERQARVEAELRDHPDKRVCFEATDVPLKGSPGEPVSVVIAVRAPVGIVSGELLIPRDRLDAALFLRALEASD